MSYLAGASKPEQLSYSLKLFSEYRSYRRSVKDYGYYIKMKTYNNPHKFLMVFAVILIVAYSYKGNTSAYSHKIYLTGDTIKTPNPLKPDYAAQPLEDWEKKFIDFQFKIISGNGHVLSYRFYFPPDLKRGKKYPLVVFLHGAGERGNDNRHQFFRFNPSAFWKKYPCFIIAPQCPNKLPGQPDGDNTWVATSFGAPASTMKEKPTWPLQLAIELLDKTIAGNPIDRSRIYITGLSMGGFGTWEFLQREPADKFAAAMPVCGGADLSFAPKFVHLPLWIFHGGADSTVLTKRSRDMVAAIQAAGGNPKYTEYPGIGHGAWTPTYSNPLVWDWLFAQHKK